MFIHKALLEISKYIPMEPCIFEYFESFIIWCSLQSCKTLGGISTRWNFWAQDLHLVDNSPSAVQQHWMWNKNPDSLALTGQGWASAWTSQFVHANNTRSMESWKHNDKASHATITSTEFHSDFVPPFVFQLYSFAPGGPKPYSVAFIQCASIIISI
jgi:hypothetical protein